MNDTTASDCTCPSGDGSLRHPCPAHPFLPAISHEQAIKLARAAAYSHCNEHSYLPQTWEVAANWQPHDWVISAIMVAADTAPPVDSWFADQLTAIGEVTSLASTPAAPGIDLTPFRLLVEGCEAEFTGTETEELEPDDSKVSYPEDRCHITFGMIRNARKALDASPKGDHVVGVNKMVQDSPKGGSTDAPKYTTGHCENHKKPGGCPLHNLQCGYPKCDRKQATSAEVGA